MTKVLGALFKLSIPQIYLTNVSHGTSPGVSFHMVPLRITPDQTATVLDLITRTWLVAGAKAAAEEARRAVMAIESFMVTTTIFV